MDEEEDPMVVVGDNIAVDSGSGLCLVGQVLTDSIVNFPSLKNTLADLWDPLRGVSITENEDKRIVFRFYSEIDLNRVMDDGRLGHGERLCLVQKILGNQQVDFGWDLSLRAAPRRGGQLVSKWLREESKNVRWASIEIDGKNMRVEDRIGQLEEMGDRSKLEDMLVKFVDGKKRQRFNSEVGSSDNNRGLLKLGMKNEILAATNKLTDQA
ncbi:hypothetical protein Goshw_007374 [Gossypium schwendimanii]|uniref:DUF4283 domain-containing protein n=1 Tax=Gossypium schwendimanii TaxID=34291 RepID=A0A7J9LLG9_GOSSC|nr:hypothetical protein [Gossypium schwendimanii]